MKLSLAYSPCPNDTFIFDAMIHQKIETEGLRFEVYLHDVEALNEKAFDETYAISKLSYHAYAYLMKTYRLLSSGSALGNNCGPLLISKSSLTVKDLQNKLIGIPGKYTTANFLLNLACPNLTNKKAILFSDIETKLTAGDIDAGLIIHENRFTYEQRGFKKIIDLGNWWEQHTKHPIPLGGIAVNRKLSTPLQQKINRVLKRSIAFAFANPTSSLSYVRKHAQEMEPSVVQQHIKLYVNDFTLDIGKKGMDAVRYLYETAHKIGLIDYYPNDIFVPYEI
jgi:1,4-dihydroxy-6-naphthoate synthase